MCDSYFIQSRCDHHEHVPICNPFPDIFSSGHTLRILPTCIEE